MDYLMLISYIIVFLFGCFVMKQSFPKKMEKEIAKVRKEEFDKFRDLLTPEENYFEYLISKELDSINIYSKKLNNLYLLKENNKTTEIDIVYITTYGIFVIEAKSYNGAIYGNVNHNKWTVVYKNGEKHSFYNPVNQNYKHIRYLNEILKKDIQLFKSIVVFDDTTVFQKLYVGKNIVINLSELKNIIRDNFIDIKLSATEIDNIYDTLVKYEDPSLKIKRQHIDYVNSIK